MARAGISKILYVRVRIPYGAPICLDTRIMATNSLSRFHTSYVGRFEGNVNECTVEVYAYWLPVERRMEQNESFVVKGSSPFPSTNFSMGCHCRKYGGSAIKDNHPRHDLSSITGKCTEKSVYVSSNLTHPANIGRDIHLVNSRGSSPLPTATLGCDNSSAISVGLGPATSTNFGRVVQLLEHPAVKSWEVGGSNPPSPANFQNNHKQKQL